MIEVGTNYIKQDEPCFNLSELDLLSPEGELRRYQVYTVVRNDKLATYRKDIGATKAFKTDQIRIPGGVIDEDSKRMFIEHTAGELRTIIEQLRATQCFDKRELVQTDKIKI